MKASILEGWRLLVVDDDRDSRELLLIALQSYGGEVVAVPTAEEALAERQKNQPHLLISDIKMPGMDGYDLIRQLRALEVQGEMLPAIAVTACASRDDQLKVLNAGFQAYLTKPVDFDELIVVIISLLPTPQPTQRVEAS
jgi:CheY-like chemotaxis protein